MTNDNNSLHYYVEMCLKNLPDRSTQIKIQEFLETNFPDLQFSKQNIEFIRKELGQLRIKRLKEAIAEFKARFGDAYDRNDIHNFFEMQNLKLTKMEIKSMFKTSPRKLVHIRLNAKEANFIEETVRITGTSKSRMMRFVVKLGLYVMATELLLHDVLSHIAKTGYDFGYTDKIHNLIRIFKDERFKQL